MMIQPWMEKSSKSDKKTDVSKTYTIIVLESILQHKPITWNTWSLFLVLFQVYKSAFC